MCDEEILVNKEPYQQVPFVANTAEKQDQSKILIFFSNDNSSNETNDSQL
jgi:hypothetical protein